MARRAASIPVALQGGGTMECKVVDLGNSSWQNHCGWPSLDLEAPDGFRFDDECHTLPCFGMTDLRQRAAHAELVPCPADCDCKYNHEEV